MRGHTYTVLEKGLILLLLGAQGADLAKTSIAHGWWGLAVIVCVAGVAATVAGGVYTLKFVFGQEKR